MSALLLPLLPTPAPLLLLPHATHWRACTQTETQIQTREGQHYRSTPEAPKASSVASSLPPFPPLVTTATTPSIKTSQKGVCCCFFTFPLSPVCGYFFVHLRSISVHDFLPLRPLCRRCALPCTYIFTDHHFLSCSFLWTSSHQSCTRRQTRRTPPQALSLVLAVVSSSPPSALFVLGVLPCSTLTDIPPHSLLHCLLLRLPAACGGALLVLCRFFLIACCVYFFLFAPFLSVRLRVRPAFPLAARFDNSPSLSLWGVTTSAFTHTPSPSPLFPCAQLSLSSYCIDTKPAAAIATRSHVLCGRHTSGEAAETTTTKRKAKKGRRKRVLSNEEEHLVQRITIKVVCPSVLVRRGWTGSRHSVRPRLPSLHSPPSTASFSRPTADALA